MALIPPSNSPTSALKWMHNNAPRITSLLNQKASWYARFNDQFWSNWEHDIFDLRTANTFGLMIWCIILGVPSQLFGLFGIPYAWAFGNNRQNFKYSAGGTPPPTANTHGGNFIGGNNTQLLDINEVRMALRMRYYTLISNGRVEMINAALFDVFGINSPLPGMVSGSTWNYAGKKYVFLADETMPTTQPNLPSGTGFTTPSAGTMAYHFGANVQISSNLKSLLGNPQWGLMPTCSSISYSIVTDT